MTLRRTSRRHRSRLAVLSHRVAGARTDHAARAVPSSIPTVALDSVARHGFFFAGGKYVGELGTEQGIDDGRRHVRGGHGAAADSIAVSHRLPSRRRADGCRLAADTRWPAGMGLQLPRDGIRRLPPGLPRARPLAVRARRRWHARSAESEHSDRAEPRRDVHRDGRRAATFRRRRSTRSGRAAAGSATRSSTTSRRRRCSSSPADGRRR